MVAERRKFISLIVTVVLVALAVAIVSILHLYQTALSRERQHLTQTVESQVLLISAVARFDAVYSREDNPEGASGATLSQIKDAYQQFQWFGETGEILIARLDENKIEYINSRRHSSVGQQTVSSETDEDRPMRLALNGERGITTSLDYRSKQVLACYAPVEDLHIGLVAKIDMAEINAPYIHSAMIVGIGAVAIALLGMILVSLTFPLIRMAETANERERRNLLAILDSIDEPIHVSNPLNHEILYVNEAFKQYWGDGIGKCCHQVINGYDQPCDDCTSPKLFSSTDPQTCTREWYNQSTNQWFRSLDKAISWPGHKLVRYEMAINITTEKEAQKAIEEQQDKVRALSSQLSLSEEQERKRLATQLHDQIGHALVAVKMKLVDQCSGDATLKQSTALKEVIEMLEDAIADVRSLTFEISPPVLHELGLGPALEWLAEETRKRHGFDVHFEGQSLSERLDNELAILLFQASRELLFNIYKHADASNCYVRLRTENENVVVEVEDNGIGFQEKVDKIGHDPRTGYGLLSISERMRFLGGKMTVVSKSGKGSTVSLSAPISFIKKHNPPEEAREVKTQTVIDRQIRVLIADDHALMRRGITSILSAFPQIELVGEASSGEQAFELALELRPNVIVMDIDMPGMDGIQATKEILGELPDTKVLALSMHANRHYVRQMLSAGAKGYVLKDIVTEELPQAIKTVDINQIYLSPSITGVLVDEFVQQQADQTGNRIEILSNRETEVVKLIVDGQSTKQIALELDISQKTAQAHRQNAFKKLGINSTAELVQLAIREGLINKE